MNIIDFKKQKIEVINKKLQELHENVKICCFCNGKNIAQLEIIVIIQVNTDVLHIVYAV